MRGGRRSRTAIVMIPFGNPGTLYPAIALCDAPHPKNRESRGLENSMVTSPLCPTTLSGYYAHKRSHSVVEGRQGISQDRLDWPDPGSKISPFPLRSTSH